jgi:putative transposon-encoded protein
MKVSPHLFVFVINPPKPKGLYMFKHINLSMRKIQLTKNKVFMEDEIIDIYEEQVKSIGNGVMIMSLKKFIGKKVYVLIRN